MFCENFNLPYIGITDIEEMRYLAISFVVKERTQNLRDFLGYMSFSDVSENRNDKSKDDRSKHNDKKSKNKDKHRDKEKDKVGHSSRRKESRDVRDDEERRRRENNRNEERDRDRQGDRGRQNDRMEEREREGQRVNYRDDEQQQYRERQRNNYRGRQRRDESGRYSDSSEDYDYRYRRRSGERIGRRYWDNTDSGSEYEAVAGTMNEILTELRNDRASRQGLKRESLSRELLRWGVVFHGKEEESVDTFIELVD
jgi:hypothetical protein